MPNSAAGSEVMRRIASQIEQRGAAGRSGRTRAGNSRRCAGGERRAPYAAIGAPTRRCRCSRTRRDSTVATSSSDMLKNAHSTLRVLLRRRSRSRSRPASRRHAGDVVEPHPATAALRSVPRRSRACRATRRRRAGSSASATHRGRRSAVPRAARASWPSRLGGCLRAESSPVGPLATYGYASTATSAPLLRARSIELERGDGPCPNSACPAALWCEQLHRDVGRRTDRDRLFDRFDSAVALVADVRDVARARPLRARRPPRRRVRRDRRTATVRRSSRSRRRSPPVRRLRAPVGFGPEFAGLEAAALGPLTHIRVVPRPTSEATFRATPLRSTRLKNRRSRSTRRRAGRCARLALALEGLPAQRRDRRAAVAADLGRHPLGTSWTGARFGEPKLVRMGMNVDETRRQGRPPHRRFR